MVVLGGVRRLGLAVLLAGLWRHCLGSLKLLEENGLREEVVTTRSGLQYEVLESGPLAGPLPNASSSCVLHYRGTLLNGTEFYSSYNRSSPKTYKLTELSETLAEALQLMRAGDKWKLYMPSELAYGNRDPFDTVLAFEVELLEVLPDPDGVLAQAIAFAQDQFRLAFAVVCSAVAFYVLHTSWPPSPPTSQCVMDASYVV